MMAIWGETKRGSVGIENRPPLAPYDRHVFVCTGPRCAPGASEEIYQVLGLLTSI